MSSIIKWILTLLIVVAAGWGVWSYQTAHLAKPPPTKSEILYEKIKSEGLPSFQLPRLDGRAFSIEEVKDKLVILNFWASWCGPCEQEFPSMLELINSFKGQVVIVAISIDEKKDDVEKFLSKYNDQINEHLVVLHDPTQETPKLFGTFKLPESYILKPGLKMVDKVVGAESWTTPQRHAQITELLTP